MLKINTVTMEEKIVEILEKYEVSNWDLHKITEELLNLFSVSESNFNDAIKYIEGSYCDTHLNTPYMLLGDVTELIKILTGREVDWQELAKHSR